MFPSDFRNPVPSPAEFSSSGGHKEDCTSRQDVADASRFARHSGRSIDDRWHQRAASPVTRQRTMSQTGCAGSMSWQSTRGSRGAEAL